MPDRNNRGNNSDQDGPTIEAVLAEAERKMGQSIEAMRRDISTLRTGRATPALIEDLSVDYYGSPTPLKQIASISAPDARAIMVQPWDRQALRDIERSLTQSEMGFNPSERWQCDHRAHPAADPGTAPGDGAPAEAQGGG